MVKFGLRIVTGKIRLGLDLGFCVYQLVHFYPLYDPQIRKFPVAALQ